jgi:hypothetical protein
MQAMKPRATCEPLSDDFILTLRINADRDSCPDYASGLMLEAANRLARFEEHRAKLAADLEQACKDGWAFHNRCETLEAELAALKRGRDAVLKLCDEVDAIAGSEIGKAPGRKHAGTLSAQTVRAVLGKEQV